MGNIQSYLKVIFNIAQKILFQYGSDLFLKIGMNYKEISNPYKEKDSRGQV